MNVRMLWLGYAQSLLALSLAGCCCCEPAVPRANCGRAAKHDVAGRCGSAQGCVRAAPKLVHRPLFKFEQVCPHGFPPYNPAPLGYATGVPHVVETSISRHVEFGPSTSQAGPRQAPAELPPVVDQNAKRLPAEDATDGPSENASVKSPDVKTPTELVQPNHAPRTTEPPPSDDVSAEDAPSPDSDKQPVSVPAPADKPQDDLPSNPLRGREENAPKAEAPTPSTDTKAPASEPQPTPAEEQPDAPAPKSSNDGDGNDGNDTNEPADSKPNDGGEEEWPDAPLPKNDLPPLAGPVR